MVNCTFLTAKPTTTYDGALSFMGFKFQTDVRYLYIQTYIQDQFNTYMKIDVSTLGDSGTVMRLKMYFLVSYST
jgi:hypothetical protein